MSKNSKTTSSRVAGLAAQVLRDADASAIQKRLAGSALSQVTQGKQTSAEMEAEAGRVLNSEKYNETTKALAATVVSQSTLDR